MNLWQRGMLRIFMFLATYLNDEVDGVVKIVNGLDYRNLCTPAGGSQETERERVDIEIVCCFG